MQKHLDGFAAYISGIANKPSNLQDKKIITAQKSALLQANLHDMQFGAVVAPGEQNKNWGRGLVPFSLAAFFRQPASTERLDTYGK